MITLGTRIDGDRRLLQFDSYDEYLDALVIPKDLFYLRSTSVARQVAELGYRCTGETLDKHSFNARLRAVKNLLFPVQKAYELSSELLTPSDPFEQQLAFRERSNRLGVLSTIIFVRNYTRFHFEVSGYIDFKSRLENEDWRPFFQGRIKLWPQPTDLGYYHWRMGTTLLNESNNYVPVIDPERGLLFKNIHDRKLIWVDPGAPSPGVNTTRVRIHSDKYEQIILYDHIVRSKI
ncbi:uncharacterized protein C4orf22 homolog [Cephus cinctus]|uniref:Cilia- and flagella-associated protein 299 n=1 Tax=Cephus cinctus TaxID=211228 RepID=A0AAJ7C6J8_CEPCN|nr:uncharacterized protein C4orf22 homolog [Cephus cinctus]